jgi:thermostable 8-oxoguanine DNA glycosylase
MIKQPKKTGEAYAFFNCRASKEEIERELPFIRDAVKTPNQLELSLTEGIDLESFKHLELKEIAREAKETGIRYSMKASYKDVRNKQTADELARVLNQSYQSPLYQDKEEFRGGIFYKKNRHYIGRE